MYKFILGVATVIAIGALYLAFSPPVANIGNVITQGIVPKIATSSTISVGPQAVTTIFSANSACTTRIVTTFAQAVMLSFSSSVTPTGTVGHLQSGSTTVAYDNALYGCGAVTTYGFASTTITTSAFSQ
jgi:hypothetical protein